MRRENETHVTVYHAKVKCINLFLHGILGWRIVGILSRRSRGSGRLPSSVSVPMPLCVLMPLGGVVVSPASSFMGVMREPFTVVTVELEGTGW